ncbi:uncharacterized protein LOC129580756 [Paramacrobiotus metropolitanus]|uniref:uncharacterized protein LOC129580756 n=1 Tax=Paramacrobiotus metropolitanus TaxID=2943436 RepID=UPI002446298C|nr:uncharacterized protein LOC129580756 [Paramacrobiotus metropolitanus]
MASSFDTDEIKEFHFHTYFLHTNKDSTSEAEVFHSKVRAAIESGVFVARCGTINYGPRGPHMIGNFYCWVPVESFQKAYNFYLLNRGNLIVLVHPLTKLEVKDHTERAVWMGSTPLPLDMVWLKAELMETPFEYPELQLGYSSVPKQ